MKTIIKKLSAFMLVIASAALVMTACNDNKGGNDPDPVDKTVLQAKVLECEALIQNASTDDYPQSAITAFQKAINDTKADMASETITQAQVNNLVTYLNTAMNTFVGQHYGNIDPNTILTFFDFNTVSTESVTATGTKPLVAKLMKGPSEIYGTDAGTPTFVDGVKGKAIRLEKGAYLSVDSYVPNNFLLNAMTISAWVKPDVAENPHNYIISLNYWNNWKLQVQEQGKPFFTVATTEGTVDMDNELDASFKSGQWTHVAVSMNLNAKTVAIYIDGTLTKEWTSTDKTGLAGTIKGAYESPLGIQLPMYIGTATSYAEALEVWTWGDDWKQPENWDALTGAIDNLGIYSAALTAGQIKKLYDEQKQ